MSGTREAWPAVPLTAWDETYTGLLLRLQIVGNVRLACSPWLTCGLHVLHRSGGSGTCGLEGGADRSKENVEDTAGDLGIVKIRPKPLGN
jgi:hypothetical protein